MVSLILGVISLLSGIVSYTRYIENAEYRILLIFLSIMCGIIGLIKNKKKNENDKISEVGETLCVLGIAASIALILFTIIIAIIYINIFKSWFNF